MQIRLKLSMDGEWGEKHVGRRRFDSEFFAKYDAKECQPQNFSVEPP